MRLHPCFLALAVCLTVSSLLLIAGCHQAQDPQPTNSPEFSFGRTFRNVPSNYTQTVNYPSDSLTYSVTRFHHNLRIELLPKNLRKGQESIVIRIDSAALQPELTGAYTLPLLDTTTYVQHPSSLLAFYTYTTESNASSKVAQSLSQYNFLPGSTFTVTSYDRERQTVSGRFELRFPVWDPTMTTYVVDRNWRAILSGEFLKPTDYAVIGFLNSPQNNKICALLSFPSVKASGYTIHLGRRANIHDLIASVIIVPSSLTESHALLRTVVVRFSQ